MNKLRKKIMRRIYLAFLRQTATHPITMKIGLFVLALYTFGKLVFVQRVLENLANTEITRVPIFLFRAFMHSEVLTLMAIGVMVYVLLSIPWQLRTHVSRERMVV